MRNYILYEKLTGKVTQTGICQNFGTLRSLFPTLSSDIEIIEGWCNSETHYIKDKKITAKTNQMIDAELLTLRKKSPKLALKSLSTDMTLEEVDLILNTHFMNDVDIATWKEEHYKMLRSFFYPDIREYIDAQVKKAQSGIVGEEGSQQLQEYIDKCYNIKLDFPKGV